MAIEWPWLCAVGAALFIGFLAGRASMRRSIERHDAVWKLLVQAAKTNQPIPAFTMCQKAHISSGSLYPYLARLERDKKIIRTREEPAPADRPARYFYAAVLEDTVTK